MRPQKHLFNLPEEIHYLNCAYMSPLLSAVEEVGLKAILRLRDPSGIRSVDFFTEQELVKRKFGQLINGKPSQVAIIPSVSYGLKSAVSNIPINSGTHAITIGDEFPSDYLTLSAWCLKNNKELKVIQAPAVRLGRGKIWTEQIIDSINPSTAAVVMSSVHWMNGTKFNLEAIGRRCKDCHAMFIVDGSQSVGILPMDVIQNHVDALICTGYKWLFGPYSIGLAYYSESFDQGEPLEDSWMNRANAEDFTRLTDYTEEYKAGAARFNMGESSNFILLPMMNRALEQILEWSNNSLQDYCGQLIAPLVQYLQENNYGVEEEAYRTNHLLGILLPEDKNREKVLQELRENKIYVSLRGNIIRMSTHLFNTEEDIGRLLEVLKM